MSFRHLEHTADLAIEARAATLEELFAEALRGMTDCVTDLARVRPERERRVELSAATEELLLVEWLSEALYAFDTGGELYSQAAVRLRRQPGELRLEADVRGEPWDDGRHRLKVAIKGVTYHRLLCARSGDGWRARVVFDI